MRTWVPVAVVAALVGLSIALAIAWGGSAGAASVPAAPPIPGESASSCRDVPGLVQRADGSWGYPGTGWREQGDGYRVLTDCWDVTSGGS